MKKISILNKLKLLSLFILLGLTISAFQNKTILQPHQPNEFKYRNLENKAFKMGEKLSFRAHYLGINAATIDIEIQNTLVEKNSRKCFHIKADGKTVKSFDWMYKVRDKFDTYLDQDALAPIHYTKSVQEDKYFDTDLVNFKHEKKKLFGAKGTLEMPEYTQDVISALYYVRNIDFSKAKKGDTYPINVYLDNKIYNLSFKYDGTETIKTDIGTINCIRFIPQLVADRVFKDEKGMTVWVSNDANKIPIRVKSDLMVGSIKVDITTYSNLKNEFISMQKKKK